MANEIKITCPCCDHILVVDRFKGKVLEVRKPLVEESSGDRLKDAFTKAENDRKKRAAAFDNIKETLERKKKEADDLFKTSLDEAKNDESKPNSVFDLD